MIPILHSIDQDAHGTSLLESLLFLSLVEGLSRREAKGRACGPDVFATGGGLVQERVFDGRQMDAYSGT